jgi:hypothetical protein
MTPTSERLVEVIDADSRLLIGSTSLNGTSCRSISARGIDGR